MATDSAFPSDLPPRPQATFKDRHCANTRSCVTFTLSAYNPITPDKAVVARRVCMILILLLRTAISILSVVVARLVWFYLGSILAVIGFFFVAWCLAAIGEARGQRKVLGVHVGRWHLDVFLFVMALAHVVVLTTIFFGFWGAGLEATWTILWVLIAAVAWVATRAPEEAFSHA